MKGKRPAAPAPSLLDLPTLRVPLQADLPYACERQGYTLDPGQGAPLEPHDTIPDALFFDNEPRWRRPCPISEATTTTYLPVRAAS